MSSSEVVGVVQELSRRNHGSVMESLSRYDVKMSDFSSRLDGISATLAGFSERLAFIEDYIMAERIKNMGSGATVRS